MTSASTHRRLALMLEGQEHATQYWHDEPVWVSSPDHSTRFTRDNGALASRRCLRNSLVSLHHSLCPTRRAKRPRADDCVSGGASRSRGWARCTVRSPAYSHRMPLALASCHLTDFLPLRTCNT